MIRTHPPSLLEAAAAQLKGLTCLPQVSSSAAAKPTVKRSASAAKGLGADSKKERTTAGAK